MKVFGNYSKFYDLLYQDKDYAHESNFVDELLQQYCDKQPHTLLELGSGTGRHAYYLAKKGYQIHGIDQSALMLEIAGTYLATKDKAISQNIVLHQGDIRHLALPTKFDAVISLFHVMSYQTTNQDLEAVFRTVKDHLRPSGVFVFDCWYGPAVLNQVPQVRYKRMQSPDLQVARVTLPTLIENQNIVQVHFDLFIQEKDHSFYSKMEEDHFMRYLFYPEVQALCDKFGFSIQIACEWLTRHPLSTKTWGACFVVKL